MAAEQYVYTFTGDIDPADLEDSLALAALATASLRGDVAVSLDAAYRLNVTTRTCTIDASTPVGAELNRIFYGFAAREFGTGAFCVERTFRTAQAGAAS